VTWEPQAGFHGAKSYIECFVVLLETISLLAGKIEEIILLYGRWGSTTRNVKELEKGARIVREVSNDRECLGTNG
jgi:hypothetical protein